ncbi:hypothetical protein ACFQ68_07905 [Amycolatopsis japonica]|uniref:hypothetical protein n=1 Tax=Amycolatopsis japonica TaxID=208439 RepID=UPI00366CECE0
MRTEAERILADPVTPWEDCGSREIDGPANPHGLGDGRRGAGQRKGSFAIRAVHARGVGLVQMTG